MAASEPLFAAESTGARALGEAVKKISAESQFPKADLESLRRMGDVRKRERLAKADGKAKAAMEAARMVDDVELIVDLQVRKVIGAGRPQIMLCGG